MLEVVEQAALHPIVLRVVDDVAGHEPSQRREEGTRERLAVRREGRRLGDEPPEPRMVGRVDAPHRGRG
jgi:hypothetical protein